MSKGLEIDFEIADKIAVASMKDQLKYLKEEVRLHVVIREAFTEANDKRLEQDQGEYKCNPHPKAPHGFNRNASHSEDRYVCECEGWDAYEAGKMEGVRLTLDEWEKSEPPQQRKPLNQKQINRLIKDAGYGDEQNEKISDFINGIAFAEAAHGIKE